MQNISNGAPRNRTNVTCFYCRKVGHLASDCRKKQTIPTIQ
uniref:CCHC-type domain-containing protein n=1 Tax=Tetranychus urticae TaxID=32264 RepID=T1L289_TETUR